MAGYTLIIGEKPSAAKTIAEALADGGKIEIHRNERASYYEFDRDGKHIIVAPAVGHVYGLVEANKGKWDYPVFDTKWTEIWNSSKDAGFAKPYLENIKLLAPGASEFIGATDFDVEGSVINFNILRFACGVENAKRMKFSTLTKNELIDAYENAMPQLDFPQIEGGLARHELDWLYGINISRALTIAIKKAGRFSILSTGRVQGPALSILTEREKEIRSFTPVPFWQLELHCEKNGVPIVALHVEDKFWDKKKADDAIAHAKPGPAIVEKLERKQYKQAPPTPFDLTNLQTEAYRHFGYTPKITQQIAQSLYERALISYPRTSSQKLPEKIGYLDILKKLGGQGYKELSKSVLSRKSIKPNEGEKDDPAHPSIFPTGEPASKAKLNPVQQKVYDLIVRRFFAVFGDPATRETLNVTLDVNGEKFLAAGRRTVEKGWMDYYGPYAKFEEVALPELKEKERVKMNALNMLNKETQPSARYNASSLIKKLEKENIGTKATRADIIQTLYDRGYIKDKSVTVTDLGLAVIECLTKHTPKIISVEMTREFEEKMDRIKDGSEKREAVIEEAKKVLLELLSEFKTHEGEVGKGLLGALSETQRVKSILGKCNKCGGDLKKLFNPATRKQFCGCSGYPTCRNGYPLPLGALIEASDKVCEKCNTPIIKVIRKGKRPFTMCLDPKCETKANWGKKKDAAAPATTTTEGGGAVQTVVAPVATTITTAAVTAAKPRKTRTTTSKKKKNALEDVDTVEDHS